MTIEVLANAFLCLLAVVMLVYLITYIVGSPWWASKLGWIYSVKTWLFTLVLIQNAASALTDSDYPGRQILRLVLYAGSTVAMLGLWTVLRKYQREGKAVRASHGDTRSRWQVWIDVIRRLRGNMT